MAVHGASWPVENAGDFLYGASVYPELQTREEQERMLDIFQQAHMNTVRVAESSWGNLETAPGVFAFEWLEDFLDLVHERGMKAVLGTSSYIAPQWLSAEHPEILEQYTPDQPMHPMQRHQMCRLHPEYRAALRRYLKALGGRFAGHPAVIAWQLDNEIEWRVQARDHNPANIAAWHQWLAQEYQTPEKLNERLNLTSWGMRVQSFEQIPIPIMPFKKLPALNLAYLHYRRDEFLEFLAEQAQVLREAGVTDWVFTDWNTFFLGLADDAGALDSMDVAGINIYQPTRDAPQYWRKEAWHLDKSRSTYGKNAFIVAETTAGATGDTIVNGPLPSHERYMMWMLQPAAFGAVGLWYWSGNKWTGGHWPHWGAVIDWRGEPEVEFPWYEEAGAFYKKWGKRLIENPVIAKAALLTDFDQRAALTVYPHIEGSENLIPEACGAFHRIGVGVDPINSVAAREAVTLDRYDIVVLAGATVLSDPQLIGALESYARRGGHVLVTPLTAYQSWDGIIDRNGLGAKLAACTGAVATAVRAMGTEGRHQVVWEWDGMASAVSPLALNGCAEFLEVTSEADVIATFDSEHALLDRRPAAVHKHLGDGTFTKLAFWANDDTVSRLARALLKLEGQLISGVLPAGVQAVPRTDGSLFVVNTGSAGTECALSHPCLDRLSDQRLEGRCDMPGFAVRWLEPVERTGE